MLLFSLFIISILLFSPIIISMLLFSPFIISILLFSPFYSSTPPLRLKFLLNLSTLSFLLCFLTFSRKADCLSFLYSSPLLWVYLALFSTHILHLSFWFISPSLPPIFLPFLLVHLAQTSFPPLFFTFSSDSSFLLVYVALTSFPPKLQYSPFLLVYLALTSFPSKLLTFPFGLTCFNLFPSHILHLSF